MYINIQHQVPRYHLKVDMDHVYTTFSGLARTIGRIFCMVKKFIAKMIRCLAMDVHPVTAKLELRSTVKPNLAFNSGNYFRCCLII